MSNVWLIQLHLGSAPMKKKLMTEALGMNNPCLKKRHTLILKLQTLSVIRNNFMHEF